MSDIVESSIDAVRVIQLQHESRTNPFSRELENQVKQALRRADADEAVGAVVIHGGPARSFSTGGDFNEVKNLSGGAEVDEWIDRVTDLYTTVLALDKPSVAAIDGFAIGMGFQFALMFDWRVMSRTGELRMPELKHGIGCSMGAAILGEAATWNAMREIVYGCESIPAAKALEYGLVNELADSAGLLERAVARAASLAGYPRTAFTSTKRVVNRRLVDALAESAADSKRVHRAAFAARDAQRHFHAILGSKY